MSSQIIQAKIKKLVEIRTDSSTMLDALNSLSAFYEAHADASRGAHGQDNKAAIKTTADARRELRSDLEKQSFRLAEEFLASFEDFEARVEDLERVTTELDNKCLSIQQRIQQNNEDTSRFMTRITELLQKKDVMQKRHASLSRFLENFQLSEEQAEALRTAPVDAAEEGEFFRALRRAKEVRKMCQDLLSSDHHTAGIELLERSAGYQDIAYDRLYRWVQDVCSNVTLDLVDVIPVLHLVMRELVERPAYFLHSQETICSLRSGQLLRRFIFALSRGDRPIEMHAHDPVRFVGEMLAWTHQALAAESDFLRAINGLEVGSKGKPGKSSELNQRNTNEEATGNAEVNMERTAMTIEQSLHLISDGVSKPLAARVKQVCAQQKAATMAYRLCHLVGFYYVTISSFLSQSEGPLTASLAECRQEANQTFKKLLEGYISNLRNSPPPYPSDLSPTMFTVEAVALMSELCETYDNSLLDESEPECQIGSTLLQLSDALLAVTEDSAQALDRSDISVLMLNNIYHLTEPLKRFDFAGLVVRDLLTKAEAWLSSLGQNQAQKLLTSLGISEVVKKIHENKGKELSKLPGLDRYTLAHAMRQFYGVLAEFNLPQIDRLRDPVQRDKGKREISILLSNAHNTIYEALHDEKNGYEDPFSITLHSPDQVRALLDIV